MYLGHSVQSNMVFAPLDHPFPFPSLILEASYCLGVEPPLSPHVLSVVAGSFPWLLLRSDVPEDSLIDHIFTLSLCFVLMNSPAV